MRRFPWAPAFATILMFYNCYVPGGAPWAIFGCMVWIIIGILAGIRLVKNFKSIPKFWSAKNIFTASNFYCLIMLIIACVLMTEYPKIWAFNICRHELESYAKQVKQNGTKYKLSTITEKSPPTTSASIYQLIDFGVEADGGVYLVTYKDRCFDLFKENFEACVQKGFAFKPSSNNRTEHDIDYSYETLGHDWYIFEKNQAVPK